MKLLDAAARLALSWVFVRADLDVLRRPQKPAVNAAPVLAQLRRRMPADLPDDETVVRANAGVQLLAATALATGTAPRLAAAVLIGSLIPTTAGGHRFWEFDDPAQRLNQRNHFNKNVAVLGGLLLVLNRRPTR